MCGYALVPPAKAMETRGLPAIDESEMFIASERSGSALTPHQKFLRLQFEGYGDSKIVDLPVGKTILLGRSANPDDLVYDELIALDDYAGYLRGVSRNHVLLRRTASALSIVDLGSRNGTFINGKKLKAFEPYTLAEIDEIQLGYLNIKLSLQTQRAKTG
jgi:hypothetical protein